MSRLGERWYYNTVDHFSAVGIGGEFASSRTGWIYVKTGADSWAVSGEAPEYIKEKARNAGEQFGAKTLVYQNQPPKEYLLKFFREWQKARREYAREQSGGKIIMPRIKHVMPAESVAEIVGMQNMQGPVSPIATLRRVYGTSEC